MALRVTTATPSGAQAAIFAGPITRIQPKPEKTTSVLASIFNSCLTSFGKSATSFLEGGVSKEPTCFS